MSVLPRRPFCGSPPMTMMQDDLSDALRGQSVVVTGGDGFVGSYLVRQLLMADANVTCLLRPKTPLRRLGMCERGSCASMSISARPIM